MKNILLLCSLLLLGQNLFGKCAGNGLWVYSTTDKITINTVFLLEGYGDSQSIIDALNEKYPVYLQSGKEKIKLVVVEKNEGLFRLKQALLKPEKSLSAGLVYSMHISNLPEREELRIYNDYSPNPKVQWTVLTNSDTKKPEWLSLPKESSKSYVEYGCGPATYVNYACKASDESELFVKTSLKNLKTGKITNYYLPIESGEIKVGHGMCSGAFDFEKNTKYEVKFELMDISGNVAEQNTSWIGLQAP